MSACEPELPDYVVELVADHYAAVAGDMHKDTDCHWRLCECWAYGKRLGWVVEHHGYCYEELEDGEDGPFATREEAVAAMAAHLRRAIGAIQRREAT